jgi:heme a synthase
VSTPATDTSPPRALAAPAPPSAATVVAPAGDRLLGRLSAAAAVLSLVVIAVGGATRATDSGLACPTWPGCFTGGDFLPPLRGQFVDGLGRTVTGLNVWLEHSHRLLAGVLGLLVAAVLVRVLQRHRRDRALLLPALGAAVAVNVQALLGALVVWNLVQAELVTAHLGLGTATMVLLVVLAARAAGSLAAPADDAARRTWRFAAAVTGVLWLQVLVGGHLSGLHGGLAFKSDPLLGLFSVGPITIEPEAVNVAHRWLAYAVAGLVVALAVRLRRTGAPAGARRWATAAVHLVAVQILLGVANLYSDLSFLSVIPHLAVASWILASLALVVVALSRPAGARA